MPLRALGVNVIVARDAGGEFKEKLLTNNWVNSAEQRSLMLTYPGRQPGIHPLREWLRKKRNRGGKKRSEYIKETVTACTVRCPDLVHTMI